MIRSALAVLAGIAILTATSFAIEAVANPLLMRMFPQALPDRAALGTSVPAAAFLFLYSTACVTLGGYVTAWLARRSRVWHALTMGVVQMALTVWAMLSIPDQAPLRNWILAIALSVPAAWFGGVLRSRQAR